MEPRTTILRRAWAVQQALRSRQLPLWRARLAATLGDPAARLATGEPDARLPRAPGVPTELSGARAALCQRVQDLAPFGQPALVRAAVAAATAALPGFEARCADQRAPRRALTAAAAWLACPCTPHAIAAGEAARAAAALGSDAAAWAAAEAAATVFHLDAAASQRAVSALLAAAGAGVPPAAVLAAVDRALIAWALAPVWQRSAARWRGTPSSTAERAPSPT